MGGGSSVCHSVTQLCKDRGGPPSLFPTVMDEPAAPETPAIPPGSPPPQSALDDADVPVADCDWTAFCCDANDKNAFWWTHGGRGVVGRCALMQCAVIVVDYVMHCVTRYDVTSGVATAVVTGCNIPFDVACAGGTVCFTERGGIWRGDGVVRSHVPATGTTEILCDQETVSETAIESAPPHSLASLSPPAPAAAATPELC